MDPKYMYLNVINSVAWAWITTVNLKLHNWCSPKKPFLVRKIPVPARTVVLKIGKISLKLSLTLKNFQNGWTLPNQIVDVSPSTCFSVVLVYIFRKFFVVSVLIAILKLFSGNDTWTSGNNLPEIEFRFVSGAFTPEVHLNFRLPERGSGKITWTFFAPPLQRACEYIVNHYVKKLHMFFFGGGHKQQWCGKTLKWPLTHWCSIACMFVVFESSFLRYGTDYISSLWKTSLSHKVEIRNNWTFERGQKYAIERQCDLHRHFIFFLFML